MADLGNARKASDHRLSLGGVRSTYANRYTEFPSLLLPNDANNKKDRVDESKSDTNKEVNQHKVLRYPPSSTRNSNNSRRIVPKYPLKKAPEKTQQTSKVLPPIKENYRQNYASTSAGFRSVNESAETSTKKKDEIEEKKMQVKRRLKRSTKQNENATNTFDHRGRPDKAGEHVTRRTCANSEVNHLSGIKHESQQLNPDESNGHRKFSESETPYKNHTTKALREQSTVSAGRDNQEGGVSKTNRRASRNTRHSYQQYYIDNFVPNSSDVKENQKHTHSITTRPATISNVLGIKSEYTFTNSKPRSKSAAGSESQSKIKNNLKIRNTYRCFKAYNSVLKIPIYPILIKSKSDAANEGTHSTITSSRNRKSSDHSQGSSNDGIHLSLEELMKYRKTAAVYMNEGWQKTRKEQFYRRLEEMQMKRWRDQKINNARQQQKLEKSKKEQMKQLEIIRNKHQNTRTRRLSTQHVKWKYVIGGVESDRKQYGLPSDYYTHYGFSQKDLENPSKLRNKVTSYDKRNTKSATEHQLTNTTLLPTEKEQVEMRKRNKERYDHLFVRRSMTRTDLMDSILKKGSYTVEVEEEVQSDGTSISKLENTGDVSRKRRNSKPLLKRKSRLAVGNIIDEARQILDTLDERYSSDDNAKLS